MPYSWAAVYQDGTVFHQYDATTNVERSSEQIDRKNLDCFVLYGHNGEPILTQYFEPGQRLIYRRRTEQLSDGSNRNVCHLVGWQQTVGQQNIQHISYVFELDGRIVMASRFRDDHRWLYSIQPVPAEEIAVE